MCPVAHTRRMFVDWLKRQKKPGGRVAQALEYFKPLRPVEMLDIAARPKREPRTEG